MLSRFLTTNQVKHYFYFNAYEKMFESILIHHTLFSSRSEWDMFVVAADHPDGSSIPQNWIVPDQPSDEAWASSLHLADSE